MAFLATSMRYMHTGSPLTPVSDNERLPMEKYSPWALRNDDRVDRHPFRRRPHANTSYYPQPSPVEIEVLLKTYWTAIHPVTFLVNALCVRTYRKFDSHA